MMRALAALALLSGCHEFLSLEPVRLHADALSADAYDPAIPGLIAYYPLDQVENGVVRDDANDHDGTCVGTVCPTMTQGTVGTALSFDGVDDIVVIEADASLSTPQGFTVAAWIQLARMPGGGCVVSKQVDMSFYNNTYQLCVDDTLRGEFYSYDATTATAQTMSAPTLFQIGAWHHIALRYDGTNKTIVVDGIASAPVVVNITFDQSSITIGADIDGIVVAPWPGLVDELRIYDRALTTQEIAQLTTR